MAEKKQIMDAGQAAEENRPVPAEGSLQQKLAAMEDKYKRALAELENHRRRAQKEKEALADYAIAGFARDLLQVADNLARARASAGAENLPRTAARPVAALFEGVDLVAGQLQAVFARYKITRIEARGAMFDANWHEAMVEIPSREARPGEVLEIMEEGYKIAGRLLRPARVAIAKAPEKA